MRLLRDMLRHAYYWRTSYTEMPITRYVNAWGRNGDRALIALDDFHAAGAAWYRLYSEREPGFGFVDEQTPEVAVSVVPSRRGRGIGSDLLDALIELAKEQGHAGLSLSVADDSPAMHVFAKQGFDKVQQTDGSWTMRLNLT